MCIKCFNQRQYVKLALEAAFDQSYRPLEIVVSDDGSTDGSWELIQEVVAERRSWLKESGRDPMAVVLNRNARNLGNVGNWQKLCELAHGEILVKADGDDISLPNRVARIAELWEPQTKCLVHAAETMDLVGKRVGKFEKKDECFGAASAYARECFTKFGAIDFPLAADDEVYLWRAKMLGEVKQVPDLLVRYRIGSGFSSVRNDFRRRMCQNFVRTLESRKQTGRDFDFCRDGLLEETRIRLFEEIRRNRFEEEAKCVLWGDAPRRERKLAFMCFDHGGVFSKSGLMHRLQLLPRPVADAVTGFIMALRH